MADKNEHAPLTSDAIGQGGNVDRFDVNEGINFPTDTNVPGSAGATIANRFDEKIIFDVEYATSGLQRAGGFISDDFIPALRGVNGRRTYREMSDNDPIVGGVMSAYRRVLSQLNYYFDPADKSVEAHQILEFVEEAWNDMRKPWDNTVSAIATNLIYGWSLFEILFKKREGYNRNSRLSSKYDDGKWGWHDLVIRSQETILRWEIDQYGSYGDGIIAYQMVDPSGAGLLRIPRAKFLLFTVEDYKESPEGRSILRNAYVPYYYKKRIQELQAIGIERDLAGFPVVTVPAEWMTSDAPANVKQSVNSLKQFVSNVKRNSQEGAVLPIMYDENGNQLIKFELLTSGGSRQLDIDAALKRYDDAIAISLLAGFLTLGHDGTGSLALGVSKTDLWLMAIQAMGRGICDVINKELIPQILRINGMDDSLAPKLTFGNISDDDLAPIFTAIAGMAKAGVITPDNPLEDWIRESMGAPAQENPVTDEERTATATSSSTPDSKATPKAPDAGKVAQQTATSEAKSSDAPTDEKDGETTYSTKK